MRHVASMQEGWRRDFRALLCGKRAEAEMGDGPRDVKRSMGAGIVAVSGLGPAPKIRRPRSNLIDKFEVQGGAFRNNKLLRISTNQGGGGRHKLARLENTQLHGRLFYYILL